MDRSEWLNRLEALHARVRAKEPVTEADQAWYLAARTALVEAALEVQAVALASTDVRRTSIRVPRAAQVLLEARGWHAQSLTVDLGAGGFATLLEAPPPVSEWIKATLLLPGEGPVLATVAVTDTRAASGLLRVAFRFSEPTPEVVQRVEDYLMDSILGQLVFWDDVMNRLRY